MRNSLASSAITPRRPHERRAAAPGMLRSSPNPMSNGSPSRPALRSAATLAAWRRRVSSDPTLTTGAALPRTQLHDHIPALLEDFERQLCATSVPARAAAEDEQEGDAAAH